MGREQDRATEIWVGGQAGKRGCVTGRVRGRESAKQTD